LYKYYVEENQLLRDRPKISEALAGGVGGVSVQKLTSVRSVEIAGYRIPDVPIGVSQTDIGVYNTKRSAGNLGAGVLSRFRIVFDYGHECLWLEPGDGWNTTPFERNRTGLVLDRKGSALEVLFVAPGSPAAAAGWKIGERITSINGIAVDSGNSDAIYAFGRQPDGTEVRYTLEGGEARTLTLAAYY
jgi:hypothetical protein